MGSTHGYQEDLHNLALDYSVRLIAPGFSIQFKRVRMGLGPAFYSIQLWDIRNHEGEPVQKHNKVGLLFNDSISIPSDSELFLLPRAQYRLTGNVEIGPFQAKGVFTND